MLPSDAKSQNSDYGSFCHTPSDTFGNQTATGSGGGNGAGSPDHLDHGPEGHEIDPDHQGDTHSQPLLPSSSQSDRLDEDISSDDDAGANNAGYMRRKTKNHRSSAGKGMGFFRFIIIKQLKVRKSQKANYVPCPILVNILL